MTDWHHRACKGMNPDLFFPHRGEPVAPEARDACARCPVAVHQACLEEAVATPWLEGYWGGTTPKQRAKMRQRRERRPA